MRASLYSVQEHLPGKVSIMARPRGGDWLVDEMKALHDAHVDVLVSLLTEQEEMELDLREEREYCEQVNIRFVAFSIVDRSVPPFAKSTFQFLQQLFGALSEGKHVVLHCRQGLGRSALMAACLLVLAGNMPDKACAKLSEARGYTVPETEEQREWLVAFAQRASRGKDKSV